MYRFRKTVFHETPKDYHYVFSFIARTETTGGEMWEKGDKKPYILRSTSSPDEAAYDPPNDDVILLHRPTAFALLSNS